jgi:hypothetical protein
MRKAGVLRFQNRRNREFAKAERRRFRCFSLRGPAFAPFLSIPPFSSVPFESFALRAFSAPRRGRNPGTRAQRPHILDFKTVPCRELVHLPHFPCNSVTDNCFRGIAPRDRLARRFCQGILSSFAP